MLVSGPAGATICHYLTRSPAHSRRQGGWSAAATWPPHTTCQHSLQLLSDEIPDKVLLSTHLSFALHALLTSIWLYPDVFLNNERDATHHDPAAECGVSISSSCRSGVQSREYREYLQNIYTPSLLRSLFLPELWETNPAVIISIHGADHLIHLQQTNK